MNQLPLFLSVALLMVLLLGLLRDWLGYMKAVRDGLINKRALTANLSADVASIIIGLGLAYAANRVIVSWVEQRHWALPPWTLLAISLGASLALVITAGKLYSRYVDGRVRAFFLARNEEFPDGGIE